MFLIKHIACIRHLLYAYKVLRNSKPNFHRLMPHLTYWSTIHSAASGKAPWLNLFPKAKGRRNLFLSAKAAAAATDIGRNWPF